MKLISAGLATCFLMVSLTAATTVPQSLSFSRRESDESVSAERDSLYNSRVYANPLGEVTVYIPVSYPADSLEYFRRLADDVALAITTRFGPVAAAPFELAIVDSRRQLEEWLGGNLPDWIYAVALEYPPRIVLLVSASSLTDPAGNRFEQALLHELTHLYLYRLYPSLEDAGFPGWFHEGLAVSISRGLNRNMHRALIRGKLTRRFYTLEQLSRIYHTSSILSELAYAQSVIAAQCLEDFYGEGFFRSLFDEIRQGYSFMSAFDRAAGEPLEEFQNRYFEELHRRYNILVALTDTSVLFILLPLLVLVAYFIRILRNRIITARWIAEGRSGDVGHEMDFKQGIKDGNQANQG